MPRITLPGTLEVINDPARNDQATSCVTNALSTCTRGETLCPSSFKFKASTTSLCRPHQRGNPTVS